MNKYALCATYFRSSISSSFFINFPQVFYTHTHTHTHTRARARIYIYIYRAHIYIYIGPRISDPLLFLSRKLTEIDLINIQGMKRIFRIFKNNFLKITTLSLLFTDFEK